MIPIGADWNVVRKLVSAASSACFASNSRARLSADEITTETSSSVCAVSAVNACVSGETTLITPTGVSCSISGTATSDPIPCMLASPFERGSAFVSWTTIDRRRSCAQPEKVPAIGSSLPSCVAM